MTNYYDFLNINPAASPAEIETALESTRTKWRRLINHHDPNIVNQANQALTILEQIQGTLTNTDKRAAYDTGIGLTGVVAGLADPEALLKTMPLVPPSVKNVQSHKPVETTSDDLWACPKCGAVNPELSPSCFNCGAQLLRVCPECNQKRSLVKTGVCGNCGSRYDIAVKKRQELRNVLTAKRQEMRDELSTEEQKMQNLNSQVNNLKGEKTEPNGCLAAFGGVSIFIGCILLMLTAKNPAVFGWGIGALGMGIIILVPLVSSGNRKEKKKNEKIEEVENDIFESQMKIKVLENEINVSQSKIKVLEDELLKLEDVK